MKEHLQVFARVKPQLQSEESTLQSKAKWNVSDAFIRLEINKSKLSNAKDQQ